MFSEDEDSAVFEESSDYTSDADILGIAFNACDNAADTSYDEFDFHACLRSLNKLFYDCGIAEGVYLCCDIAFTAAA